jgi:F0F1-type ATP synthase membrane subunit c/vacuolar-type H+-ATPase subunit K
MEQVNQPATPKDDLRGMRILCLALIAGMAIFSLVISVLLLTKAAPPLFELRGYFPLLTGAAVTIAGICVVIGMKRYNKTVKEAVSQTISLQDKLNQYRTALISFMACCEMPGLLAIIGLFMTGNFLLLIVPFLMILLMASKIPTAQKLIILLGLDWNEQQQLA